MDAEKKGWVESLKPAATGMPSMPPTKVLVTGGTGLLGRALQRIAGANFYFASSRDADLRSPLDTELLFARVKPTHVIHLAARVGGLFANQSDNVGFMVDNLRINTNVLEACRNHGVEKTVTCLSTCIFPDGAELPLHSGCMHSGPPHASNEGYAYSKRMAEVLSRQLAKATGRPFVCVVPVNLYGPHDNFDNDTSHVVAALVRKACDDTVLRVRGTGAPRRQFLYANDAARMILWALESYDDSDTPLMLAPPQSHEVSIGDLATLIQQLAGCPRLEFDRDPSADGQAIKTAKCDLPDFEFTSLKDGLEQTIAWFLSQRRLSMPVRE